MLAMGWDVWRKRLKSRAVLAYAPTETLQHMTSHSSPNHGRRLFVAIACAAVLWSLPAAAQDDLAAPAAAQEKATLELAGRCCI